jgi:HK97 family phage major capsid protein
MLIRDDIVRNTAVRQDQGFLRDDGVSSTPKSLLQWAIDNIQTLNATATVSLANVTTDLGKLILKLVNANVPMTRPGWIMPPRVWNYLMTVLTTNGTYAFRDEMKGGTLWGWPYAYTTQVPITLDTSGAGNNNETDLYLADFADVVIGDSQNLIIDASGDAAYEEGGSVKSAFHRDETVIRAITEHDIVMRRTESIAIMRRITWGV